MSCYATSQAQMDRWSRSLARRKINDLWQSRRGSTNFTLRLPKNIETPGSQFIETGRFAGGHKVSRMGVTKFGIRKRIELEGIRSIRDRGESPWQSRSRSRK